MIIRRSILMLGLLLGVLVVFSGCGDRDTDQYDAPSDDGRQTDTPTRNQDTADGTSENATTGKGVSQGEQETDRSTTGDGLSVKRPRRKGTARQDANRGRRARHIDLRRENFCNCCKSHQKNVRYWVTTFERSFGDYRAGDTIQYGICPMCQKYCNYPLNDQCTLRFHQRR